MNDLSTGARELLQAGAHAARPTAADRARLSDLLRDRLGDAALLGEAGAVAAKGATTAVWVKVCAAAVGASLLAGGAMLATREAPAPVAVPVVAHAPVPPVQAPTPPAAVEAPAPAEPVADATTPAPASAPATKRADRLAQEVALLSRATSALRSGQPAAALKALGEHQSQFPKGALTQERRAARAQALCAMGRNAEAQADLAALAPQSPQAARARLACR